MVEQKNKIKVLAYLDSPTCATGFGTVARNVLLGLHATGKFDITILGINYWGTPHNFPFAIYPVGINDERDPYGKQWSANMMMSGDFDVLFTIQDSFILEFLKDVTPSLRSKNPNLKWITYFPVDGAPKRSWLEAMALADTSVTYTEWGREECEKVIPGLGSSLQIIPHGININDFHPVKKEDILNFRRQYFGPHAEKFIVTNINRNQQRKDIPRSLRAFKLFKEKCPNSLYYCHMATIDHGWDLTEVCNTLGLEVGKDVAFPQNFGPNQGFPVAVLNLIYNASDVVISCSLGEGWGLSSVEAMACAKPVIFPDNTACSGIVGEDRGILIRSGWNEEMFTVLPNDMEVLRPLASVEDMATALTKMYNDRSLGSKLGFNGYKWVINNLRWDKHVVPQWIEVFEDTLSSKHEPALVGADV